MADAKTPNTKAADDAAKKALEEAAKEIAELKEANGRAEARIAELEAEAKTAKDTAAEKEAPAATTMEVVSAKKLNIRTSPDKGADTNILCAVDPGTELEVVGGDENGWTPVKITAYAASEFLS